MNRYIDVDALIEKISKIYTDHYKSALGQAIHDFFNAVLKAIRKAPTVDVVPVVRCKDCKYWICEEQTINGKKVVRCAVDDERWTEGNDFCSFGTKFVHGHWVEDPENETIVCSNCGNEFGLEFKIDVCMNCYAKMDGKEE